MKKISFSYIGVINPVQQPCTKTMIQMVGMPTVLKAAVLFENAHLGSQETIGGVDYLYFMNLLTGQYSGNKNAKYSVTTVTTATSGSTVPKTITATKKNGLPWTGTFKVNYLNMMIAVSSLSGATASANGTSLIYIAGIDEDNSKNFIVYEVAQTIDQLYTTLTT